MRAITTILATLLLFTAAQAADQRSFATETEITYDQQTGHYLVVAKVSELISAKGEAVEKLIAAPRMTVVAGKAAAITDTAADGTSVRAGDLLAGCGFGPGCVPSGDTEIRRQGCYAFDGQAGPEEDVIRCSNRADAPNAAMALRFQIHDHWRGVGDLRR